MKIVKIWGGNANGWWGPKCRIRRENLEAFARKLQSCENFEAYHPQAVFIEFDDGATFEYDALRDDLAVIEEGKKASGDTVWSKEKYFEMIWDIVHDLRG